MLAAWCGGIGEMGGMGMGGFGMGMGGLGMRGNGGHGQHGPADHQPRTVSPRATWRLRPRRACFMRPTEEIGRIQGRDRPDRSWTHTRHPRLRVTFGGRRRFDSDQCRQGPQRRCASQHQQKKRWASCRQLSCTTPIDMARPGPDRRHGRCVSSGCWLLGRFRA